MGKYGVKNINVVIGILVEVINDVAKRLEDRAVYILLIVAMFLIALSWLRGDTHKKVHNIQKENNAKVPQLL